MIRNVITLLAHDLAVAFKNKTLLLMLCIPLFIYGTLKLVDRSDTPVTALKLGLLKEASFDPALRKNIESASDAFFVREVSNLEEGTRLLKEHALDGLAINANDDRSRVVVLVLKKESLATFAIVQRFASLQIAVEGKGRSWISDIRALQSGRIELQALPTWILMIVLLVSFLVIPAQVAEEKEKQWLLGLLQTPMREGEWLAAKLGYGMILIFTDVLALQLLSKSWCLPWSYLMTLGAGSFCFCAMGIALGLFCRSQASARALGVIAYLPLLLPAVLADLSKDLRGIAKFLPSHAFYEPIQSILLDHKVAIFPVEWLILVGMGAGVFWVSQQLIKARWLMG